MRRRRLLAPAILLAVAVTSCSDPTQRADESTTSTKPDPQVQLAEELGEPLGCDAVERTEVEFEFGGRSRQLVCTIDGGGVALIHVFDPRAHARVQKHLDRETIPFVCPDGSVVPGPWIVVGADWAVSSYLDEERMRALADEHDGEFVGEPSLGPPPSYLPPGGPTCDEPYVDS